MVAHVDTTLGPMPMRAARLVLVLGLITAACDQPEPQTRSPIDAAAEAQRRLRINGFVRSLERERYLVSFDNFAPSRGASDPLVTIVAFVDHAAPEQATNDPLERLLEQHPEDLRLVILPGEVEQAQRLDIERRPTYFVNGVALVGPETVDALTEVVEAELETARRLLAIGAERDEVYPLLMSRASRDRIEPPEPLRPVEIVWDPQFAGAALSSEQRDDGVLIEELTLGEGLAGAEGKLVEFEFDGHASLGGKQVMGSREQPAKMVLNEATRKRDPIAAVMMDVLLGMRVGGKRRVKLPAALVEAEKPEGRPPIGDLWIGIELIAVHDAPHLEPIAAFAGKPIASKRDDDGLEVVDYRRGKGPNATAGMIVTTHYIGQLADGTEFDNSHGRAEGLPVTLGPELNVIAGFARGLEGARAGMLRKLVIPPELAYGDKSQGKIPANATLIFYLQIMDVQPATDVKE